ncbi:MAG: DNA translocase FtsK [Candidatus Cryptobacteroides sp.]
MPVAEKKKTVRKKKVHAPMSEQTKTTIRKVAGIVLWAVCIAFAVGMLGYLFSWKTDQSVLSAGGDVTNVGGSWGHRLGHFLICNCFGLAAFGFLYVLAVGGYKMFHWDEHHHTLRKILLACSAIVLGGWIMSYVSGLVSSDIVFGGGLGGRASSAVVSALKDGMGPIVPGVFLGVLTIIWLLFASGSFAAWFAGLGEKKPESEKPLVDPTADGPVVDGPAVDEPLVFDEPENPEVELPPFDLPDPAFEVAADVVRENVLYDEGQQTMSDLTTEVDKAESKFEETETSAKSASLSEVDDTSYGIGAEEELPRIDQRQEDAPKFKFPSLDLLDDYANQQFVPSTAELEDINLKIRNCLAEYKIEVDDLKASIGPTVTLYKVFLAPGYKVSAVENVSREIAMRLGVKSVRVVTLPGCVGIEVPNSKSSVVPLKSMLNDDAFRNSKAELPVAIGYTITKQVKTFDLTASPHLLIAGATMQGKSVGLNVIISSLLYSKHPSELKFVFIDPKMVEFSAYNGLHKHYLAVLPNAKDEEDEKENAIVKTPDKARDVLNSLCVEMDERYKLLASAGVNKVTLYNEKYKNRRLRPDQGHHYLPYLVVIVDEYADLTMAGGSSAEARKAAREIIDAIIRLAQKGRAAGIHIIIATQRPSADVISSRIKTNFPARIAFRVVQGTDSQVILDERGAENLVGKGDMLYKNSVDMDRVQCAYISGSEIDAITDFIASQTKFGECCSHPYYLPEPPVEGGTGEPGTIDMTKVDPLLSDAAHMVVSSQRGSTTDLQRKLGVGYARAGRIMDQLEGAGVVGPQDGSKPRQVLVSETIDLEELLAPFLQQ